MVQTKQGPGAAMMEKRGVVPANAKKVEEGKIGVEMTSVVVKEDLEVGEEEVGDGDRDERGGVEENGAI